MTSSIRKSARGRGDTELEMEEKERKEKKEEEREKKEKKEEKEEKEKKEKKEKKGKNTTVADFMKKRTSIKTSTSAKQGGTGPPRRSSRLSAERPAWPSCKQHRLPQPIVK